MSKVVKEFKRLIRGKKVTKTYTNYQVASVEIIDSDILTETIQRLVLKYVQTGYGSRNYCLDYGNTGAAQFFQYYLGGIYDYRDQLPTVSVGQQLSGLVGLEEGEEGSADGDAYELTDYEVYPIVMIRNEYFNVNQYQSTSINKPPTLTQQRYEETVAMLENLGLSLEDLIDAISENSQIANVKDVYFLTGVSPSNKSPIVSQCLYKIFEEIYNVKPLSPGAYSHWNKYTIDYEENAYNQYIEWVPRAITTVTGSIGPAGTYTHDWESVNTYTDNPFQETFSTKFRVLKRQTAAGSSAVGCEVYLPTINRWHMLLFNSTIPNDSGRPWVNNFSPQIGDTIFNCDESRFSYIFYNVKPTTTGESWAEFDGMNVIQAASVVPATYYRLQLKYQFSDTQYRVITIDDLFSQTFVTTGNGSKVDQNVTHEDLVIPLPIKIVESLSFMERCDLLSHSLFLTFYAINTQTVSYYKGGIFKSFLKIIGIIIAVVISIVAPAAGGAFAGTILGGITANALANVLTNMFINFLIGMTLSVALKVIMKYSGSEALKYILSAVAMLVSVYISGGFDGVFDSLSNTLKTAADLIEIPLKITEIYSNNSIQESLAALESLQNQATAFYDQYEEYYKQYEDILNTFDTSISTEYLVGLQRMGTYTGTDINPWILSPSAFIYSAVQSQFAIDSLFANDVETFASRALSIGILDT